MLRGLRPTRSNASAAPPPSSKSAEGRAPPPNAARVPKRTESLNAGCRAGALPRKRSCRQPSALHYAECRPPSVNALRRQELGLARTTRRAGGGQGLRETAPPMRFRRDRFPRVTVGPARAGRGSADRHGGAGRMRGGDGVSGADSRQPAGWRAVDASRQKKLRSLGRASELSSASHRGKTGRHLAGQPDPPVAQGTCGREKPQIRVEYSTIACRLLPECDA